jgi:PKD repeat protein
MKKWIAAIALIAILVSAVACGTSSYDTANKLEGGDAHYDEDDYRGVTVTTTTTKAGMTTVVPQTAPPPEISEGGYTTAYDEETWSGERMIIRSGDMSLVVTDVSTAVQEINTMANTYEGFVVSSNIWQDRDIMMGSISIRVAAEYFDTALSALRNLAVDVSSESTYGQDVTDEYVDLEAKLRNLEASEAQLLRLMEEETESVSDILQVQRELVNTREDIERTKGRMQYLEQSASLSLISVRLEQSKLAVEFSASTRNVKEGEEVYFYPDVAGGFTPYSYEWDFGDGSTSNEEVPRHSYDSDGTFTVTLKVTDDRGNEDTYEREDYITVVPGWNAGGIASGAWNGLVAFGRVLADIFIWLGIFSPLWIAILVILYFAWWRKRKKA